MSFAKSLTKKIKTDETVASCPYSNQFQCSSGQCITKEWVCDGIRDCEDRSDESDCQKKKCTSSQFTCPINQKCIPNNKVCDGENDCGDNSDEHNCDNYLSQTCMRYGDLWCYNTSKCVTKNYICDGIKHCPDNSDEKECTCMTFQYKCSISGECIHRDWLCDGSKDCPRGDDENESLCSKFWIFSNFSI
ncbi:hypothetical protein HELRODRAFT_179294 [Helobdella robusta]|uniref:Uncharacterized protein n=1 Tax=Helobdella robusta TaxID=6412 RepID=T1FEH9_HELRO|nr:hypothetical protein HELRODRAFT_179294 [Helobdella robusta]ESN95518.1 hypothetical protein HELRODRAFT_179294 [Helobdella robusta]